MQGWSKKADDLQCAAKPSPLRKSLIVEKPAWVACGLEKKEDHCDFLSGDFYEIQGNSGDGNGDGCLSFFGGVWGWG
jgi:hypothetical protein